MKNKWLDETWPDFVALLIRVVPFKSIPANMSEAVGDTDYRFGWKLCDLGRGRGPM